MGITTTVLLSRSTTADISNTAEAIDLAITSIQDHFDQPGYPIYRNLETLLLKAVNKEDYSVELQEVTTCWKWLQQE